MCRDYTSRHRHGRQNRMIFVGFSAPSRPLTVVPGSSTESALMSRKQSFLAIPGSKVFPGGGGDRCAGRHFERNAPTRERNAPGSSQKGRCPLFSNTASSEPGIALWIAQATDGATLKS